MRVRRSVVRLIVPCACILLALPASSLAAGRPRNTSLPVVSGSPVVGQALMTTNGAWSNSPTSYAYRWLRCDSAGASCRKISGATASTYALVTADAGWRIRSEVRAANAAGGRTARSAATATVTPSGGPPPATAPSNTARPAISGTARTGQSVTASDGSWTGTAPITYSYQWQRCAQDGTACTPTSSATQKSYALTSADEAHALRVGVTAKNSAGSAAATSDPSGVVQPALSPPPSADGLRVSGNKLLDATGSPVQLHGVNRSGTEYACVQGWGMSDGPLDDASLVAMRSWNVNVVRVLLNETCWLGINGVNPAYSGANYRNAIVDFVHRVEAHGMYAEVSLMWGAPGSYRATYQPSGPDADHSPDMWASMAQTFKGDPRVLLAPWGETTVDADCFLQGGLCGATYGPSNAPYAIAGMQQAVDVMRANGWAGPIVVPGIDYANNLTQWLSHRPSDPLGQLMAEAHIYGKNVCGTTACMDREYAPVAAQVPLLLGETGETYDDSSCGGSNIEAFMGWADAHDAHYEAWTWDTWGTCGSLITNYDGTPKGAFGAAVKAHLLARP